MSCAVVDSCNYKGIFTKPVVVIAGHESFLGQA